MKKGIAWLIAILMIPTVSMTPVSFAAEETDAQDSIVEETIAGESEETTADESLDDEVVTAEDSEEADIATFAEEKTSENGAFVDNEVIVVFEKDIEVEEAKAVTEGEVEILSPEKTVADTEVIESGEQTLVAIDENKTVEEAVTELAEKKEVAYVQPNFIYELDEPDVTEETGATEETGETGETGETVDPENPGEPSEPSEPENPDVPQEPEPTDVPDPQRGDQWYLKYIDVQNAWDLVDALREHDGALPKDQRVKVATIDTGVSLTHEDLQKNIDKDNCVQTIGTEIIKYGKEGKEPKFKHGTNVTSIIAATSNNGKGIAGVAAGNHNDIVSVMGINPFYDMEQTIYDCRGQRAATTADIIAALGYAKEHDAQVVNMSLGHYDQRLYSDVEFKKKNEHLLDVNGEVHDDVLLEGKINELVADNITVICSAGNQGNTKKWCPSDYNTTISVIALNQFTNAYSNVKKPNSNYGKAKDLSAPGEKLLSCTLSGDYGKANNTSNATPQVTGVVALMLAVDPSLTPSETRSILRKSVTDVYKSGWDEYTAYGMVNAYNAVAETARRAVKNGKLDISISALNTLLTKTKPTYVTGKYLGTPKITSIKRGKRYLTIRWNYSSPKYLYKIQIYRAKGNGPFKCVKTFTQKANKWTNKKLKRKTKYRYKVIVYGTTSTGKKVWSAYSPIVSKKTK